MVQTPITPSSCSIKKMPNEAKVDTRYWDAAFYDVTFNEADYQESSIFNDADLFRAKFYNCVFKAVDFSKIDLESFKTIKFANCAFEGGVKFPLGYEFEEKNFFGTNASKEVDESIKENLKGHGENFKFEENGDLFQITRGKAASNSLAAAALAEETEPAQKESSEQEKILEALQEISARQESLQKESSRFAEDLSEISRLKAEIKNLESLQNSTISSSEENAKKIQSAQDSIAEIEDDLRKIDPRVKLTSEELAQKQRIEKNPNLQSYCEVVQQTFNEAFLFSEILKIKGVATNSDSTSAKVFDLAATLTLNIPFAYLAFNAASQTSDAIANTKRIGKYSNLSDLNPTSNSIDSGIFSEKLARIITINREEEIVKEVANPKKAGSKILQDLKQFFKSQIRQLSPAFAKGAFSAELTSSQSLAYEDSSIALNHIFQGNVVGANAGEKIENIAKVVIGQKEIRLLPTPPAAVMVELSEKATVVEAAVIEEVSNSKSDARRRLEARVSDKIKANKNLQSPLTTPVVAKTTDGGQELEGKLAGRRALEEARESKAKDNLTSQKQPETSLNAEEKTEAPSGKTSANSTESLLLQAEIYNLKRDIGNNKKLNSEFSSRIEKLEQERSAEKLKEAKGGCCVIS